MRVSTQHRSIANQRGFGRGIAALLEEHVAIIALRTTRAPARTAGFAGHPEFRDVCFVSERRHRLERLTAKADWVRIKPMLVHLTFLQPIIFRFRFPLSSTVEAGHGGICLPVITTVELGMG
jgi:hypothetical protein